MGLLSPSVAQPKSQNHNGHLTARREYDVWDLTVWCVYSALIAVVISRHEPWFDEAQAWLLARDVSPYRLVTHYLRYEGSPGLWHYLLILPAKAGLPFEFMSCMAGVFASAGMLVFVLLAPFPRWIRYLFPFSFFVFYQYAVVARSYVLLPLLLFLLAAIYDQVPRRPLSFAILTALLANVSLHGFILAATLTACIAQRTRSSWRDLPRLQIVRLIAALTALSLVALLITVQLSRPSDLISFGTLNLGFKHLVAVAALKLRDAFTGISILSGLLLAVSAWWFFRRRTLSLFIAGTAGLLGLAGIAYSNVWHEGILVLWWTFVMWVSWPKRHVQASRMINVCWATFLVIQLFWSVRTSWFDLYFPYSGSKQLAEYISTRHLERHILFAFGPKSAAILPYFRNSIFSNWPTNQDFWYWSTSNTIESSFAQISQIHPEYVILPVTSDSDKELVQRRQSLLNQGYNLDRRFDGAIYWKNWILEGNCYELYQAASTKKD